MSDSIHILGIHDGHNSGATLTRDGTILASISEERLTRRKNEVGYPRRAIGAVLRLGGIDARQLDEAVYASNFMHTPRHLSDVSSWYRVGLARQRADAQAPSHYAKLVYEQRRRERIAEVTTHLGLPESKVGFLDHHLCHVAAAHYTSPNAADGRPILGLSCDGAGDNISGSVTICRGSTIERIAAIDRHASLGKIYSRITLMLGMTPWEHEYKVMGLAPYADPTRADRAADALRRLLTLSEDGLSFRQAGELSTNYCYEYLREAFEGVRFDTVSGAAQRFTEEILTAWVAACIARTGIADVVCGGGVFMNVKANMLIAALPGVRSIHVMPSAGDESLSIGACLHRFYQRRPGADRRQSVLRDLYLGGAFDRDAEAAAIRQALAGHPVTITQPTSVEDEVAARLARGEIVARCAGRMEWGARALGNRSILASADDFRTVDRINRAIKQRDFWMPFAPSVLAEDAARYFDDPKGIQPRFMTFAFPTLPASRAEIAAASHPRDHTIRPQMVTADANPAYHRLIGRFKALTGRGAVLNTSFNLHGFPIVESPADAIDVFARSGLRVLALGHHVIEKKADWADAD
ncbi:MAG: hypothetical protein FJX46_01780 [Alphaproteobacteria bacterium]|nr:hypothetical protein [Alphaproteobacteria bacterium]